MSLNIFHIHTILRTYLYTHLCCLCILWILSKKNGMAIWAIHMKGCIDSCKCGKIKTYISINILGHMKNNTTNNEDFHETHLPLPVTKAVVTSVHWTPPWRCRWSQWVWEAPCWSLSTLSLTGLMTFSRWERKMVRYATTYQNISGISGYLKVRIRMEGYYPLSSIGCIPHPLTAIT